MAQINGIAVICTQCGETKSVRTQHETLLFVCNECVRDNGQRAAARAGYLLPGDHLVTLDEAEIFRSPRTRGIMLKISMTVVRSTTMKSGDKPRWIFYDSSVGSYSLLNAHVPTDPELASCVEYWRAWRSCDRRGGPWLYGPLSTQLGGARTLVTAVMKGAMTRVNFFKP